MPIFQLLSYCLLPDKIELSPDAPFFRCFDDCSRLTIPIHAARHHHAIARLIRSAHAIVFLSADFTPLFSCYASDILITVKRCYGERA